MKELSSSVWDDLSAGQGLFNFLSSCPTFHRYLDHQRSRPLLRAPLPRPVLGGWSSHANTFRPSTRGRPPISASFHLNPILAFSTNFFLCNNSIFSICYSQPTQISLTTKASKVYTLDGVTVHVSAVLTYRVVEARFVINGGKLLSLESQMAKMAFVRTTGRSVNM